MGRASLMTETSCQGSSPTPTARSPPPPVPFSLSIFFLFVLHSHQKRTHTRHAVSYAHAPGGSVFFGKESV
ncbi:hypothetical protein Krac_6097 [Ktedonobacter racemifer DSM 44963]|uniref:Uncharacterized protein n=1 Tax=Ktedonobacter racemifer DSM 44963 TaxID=485913 RepID=D6TXX2_KTERA|nr:hypothetical protein Krac_6097 [Ktedonobacter racemifer DSM 44963]